MNGPKIESGNILMIAASAAQTRHAIAWALANERGLIIHNPNPALDIGFYNPLVQEFGCELIYQENTLRVVKKSPVDAAQDEKNTAPRTFQIDDPIGLLLGLKFGRPVRLALEKREDFERKVLILRRAGAKFVVPADKPRTGLPVLEAFNPARIKFSFQESNFYLAEFMARLCAVSALEVEFLSKINLTDNLPAAVYPFELEIIDLIPGVNESDELQKRIQRLGKTRAEARFHYLIRGKAGLNQDNLVLPADPAVWSLCTVIGLLKAAGHPAVGPLVQSEGDKAFGRALGRLGLKVESGKFPVADNKEMHFLSVVRDKLSGKKVAEELLRKQPEFFGALGILASCCEGKTIIRGLPTSSSLWQTRIADIASILTGAGVRVGELEDGIVVEPPPEFNKIIFREFADPYAGMVQCAAAVCLNSGVPADEFYASLSDYSHFLSALKKIRA